MTDGTAARDRGQALAVLVAGAAIIGLAPILVRLADAGPAAVGFWRVAFAMPLLGLMALRADRGVGSPNRFALLAGLAFACDLGFWHYSIHFTSVANATVLTNLTPVVVTAAAWIFLKQRPAKLFVAAVALAVAGAWLMAVGRGAHAPGSNPPLGDALALTTALWYALYFLAISAARRSVGATRVMFWSSVASAPLLLVAAVALGERIFPATAGGWAAVIGLGVMHVAGQGSIAWALGRLPAATASVVVLIQPVVAALLGWLLFSEALGPLQALGGAIALFGVVLSQAASRKSAA
ncbi:drug/metabolite transporter (DMT)-like permease [Phenylobacterium haematophilum]|uniref:Drug/metabolite transporter (DMT)-like permease n=1 Tax=Phenylobacterium haematophilum TaxID=98513 RepID=A0A840A185_9CAUL|nr:EamA family transporter [Phenylobacterium haematophilum]MBB3891403.1 drug/metabolite transporter (DMT)-like permease [Phenylobacterium haematophilum]